MTPSKDYAEQKAKIINRLKGSRVRCVAYKTWSRSHDRLTLLSGIRSALNATGDIILATYLEKCQTDLKKGRGNMADLVEAVKLARG